MEEVCTSHPEVPVPVTDHPEVPVPLTGHPDVPVPLTEVPVPFTSHLEVPGSVSSVPVVISGTLLSLGLLLASCLLLLHYLLGRHRYWRAWGVPSPPAAILLGHTLRRLGLTQPFMEFFDELYYQYNGSDFCGYYDFLKPCLFVGNPELIKSILVKDFDHFTDRRTFNLGKVNPIANDMLTNARGSHWRRIRGVVSPAFTSTKTRRLYPLILHRATHLLHLASHTAHLGPVEARELCGRYTMDAIASCAFGIECEALTKEAATFPTVAAKIFQLSPTRAFKILVLLVAPRLAELAHWMGLEFTSPEFHFFRHVVTHTIHTRQETGLQRGDFLDLLMETRAHGKEGLSNDTIAAQSILFLLAGYDNTANTLAMALHLLAHHPRVQAALRREVAQALLKGRGQLTHDQVMSLPYLDAVVSEVLRLYPAAPVIERVCTKNYIVGVCGVEVEEGMGVLVPVWSVHRDARYWPHPQQFLPERFLGSARAAIMPYTYLPFGAGPRSCIGVKFALLSVKAGLVSLLTSLEVLPCPASPNPLPLDPRVLTLQPKDGVYVNLQPIELQEAIEQEMTTHEMTTQKDNTETDELERH